MRSHTSICIPMQPTASPSLHPTICPCLQPRYQSTDICPECPSNSTDACLPPRFQTERVGCHLPPTRGVINSSKSIIRKGSTMSTKKHWPCECPHTRGGCLHPSHARRQRDAHAHGPPTSHGSLILVFRWFSPNNGWMTDRSPRNPTEQPKHEPQPHHHHQQQQTNNDTDSSIANSSTITIDSLTCAAGHLPTVNKRCSCRAYPPALFARRRGALSNHWHKHPAPQPPSSTSTCQNFISNSDRSQCSSSTQHTQKSLNCEIVNALDNHSNHRQKSQRHATRLVCHRICCF